MKIKLMFLLLSVLSVTGMVYGNITYTVAVPSGLDHSYAYAWTLQTPAEFDTGTIIGAVLTYKHIYDWSATDPDVLYTHLLDNPGSTIGQLKVVASDADNAYDDYFAGQGVKLGEWSDPVGGSSGAAVDLVYTFDSAQLASLVSYMDDGNFGFGIDADCHYWLDGIEFEVITTVPAPGALLLGSMGVAFVGWLRRKNHI